MAEGCVQSGAALIGGETAEHPGMMPVEDYDLAGFAVGIVDKKKIIDNSRMKAGDVVILGGKGAETTQRVNGRYEPYLSDELVVRNWLFEQN